MANKLAHSTSPYLQQHADNPVDWHEWGPEALDAARAAGKPILLSIGYSACHWCHVMAHESFEDDAIAARMNALFVNIKVDREERPDIDQIYQTAHAMLTQRSGGWPLTMFLTPDTVPFFGGTYFPKTARYGLPGFGDLLQRVAAYHREQSTAIGEQNARLLAALSARETPTESADGPLDAEPLDAEMIAAARAQLARHFDARHGGFSGAPKFPHPETVAFLLRRQRIDDDAEAGHMARHTLDAMCRGGIYDQLGGGFARYAVDAAWTIPHFEKMLYDNGPLLRLLADAYAAVDATTEAAQRARFAQCAAETAAWVMRDMQSPAGGYYASLDADSEGHEGRFYVWTPDAARTLLTEAEWNVAAAHFGLDGPPNFEEREWHLTVAMPLEKVAQAQNIDPATAAERLAAAKAKLLAAREKRVWPGRDEKILTSWNALMIEGMACAGRVFNRPEWLASARRALDFLQTQLWDVGRRRLFATHRDGITRLNAYLDDYALSIAACLAMLEADFRAADLAFAQQLADVLLAEFEDRDAGGFFFTGHSHEPLIQRPKPGFDNATPSGNGVAARALARLAHLTGDWRYADAAERTLRSFAHAMREHPSGHCSLLMALEEALTPPAIVILAGPSEARAQWRAELARLDRPDAIVVDPLADPHAGDASGLPVALVRPAAAAVTAHVCHGTHCLPPIDRYDELIGVLEGPIMAGSERFV